jgi:hypothetical protein
VPSADLLKPNREIEKFLDQAAYKYIAMQDVRWMFAFAHFRITQRIDDEVPRLLFRDPDQLLRFNISFATAFLAAVSGNTSLPWKAAFQECANHEWLATHPFDAGMCHYPPSPNCQVAINMPTAVQECAMAMAKVHINIDVVHALETVGCIDPHDFGNILLFVETASKDAILLLHGSLTGPVFNGLKQMLLPLDKIWRNAAYEKVCHIPVPNIEQEFRDAVERNTRRMNNPLPGHYLRVR